MQIVGSDKPEFYLAGAKIREHLPHVNINQNNLIIYDENRYYGIITPDGDNVMYDHVVLDPFFVNPQNVFMVLTTVFKYGKVLNTFVAVKNARAIRLLQGLGFVTTGILRQSDGDYGIFSMTVDEWVNNRIRNHYIKNNNKN